MMKSHLYSIPLTGLKDGGHLYEFEVDDDLFAKFEESEIRKGSLKAVASLVKRSTHMELKLDITGSVELICDRCLEPYLQKVDTTGKLVIKYGEQWEEVDDEVLMIPYGESILDLTQLIYEFSHLGLPIQKVHGEDKDDKSECDPEMLKRIAGAGSKRLESIDPRWEGLGGIKSDKLN
jgi:uncharacterized metal-binding protein YceD (DUF177 family)